MIIQAKPGETFPRLFLRAKDYLWVDARCYVDVCHNGITVTIYEDSYINDSCQIYDLKATIRRMENK